MHGETLGKAARIGPPPVVTVRLLQRETFAITRMTCSQPVPGMTKPIPRADAFVLFLQLRDSKPYEQWYEGRRVSIQQSPRRGTVGLLDLNRDPRAVMTDSYDVLSFSFPRMLLDATTAEHGVSGVETLAIPPGAHFVDPTIQHIGQAILPSLAEPEGASKLFVEHISLALMSHLAAKYGGVRLPSPPKARGLSPRQERRAKELLIAHLDGEISLETLARECGLSRSHFARSFKLTTGEAPHRWQLARRVERARDLLRRPTLPIAEISRSLGFADQSHFTRTFRNATGLTPAAWRRLSRD